MAHCLILLIPRFVLGMSKKAQVRNAQSAPETDLLLDDEDEMLCIHIFARRFIIRLVFCSVKLYGI